MPEFIAGLATPVSTTAPEGKIGAHPPFALQDPKGAVIWDNFTPHDAPLVAAACQDPTDPKRPAVSSRRFLPRFGPKAGPLGRFAFHATRHCTSPGQ